MSTAKKDVHKDTTKLTAFRRNSHDRSSAHNPGSAPTLPLLTYHSPTFMGEPTTDHPLNKPQISQFCDISVVELPQLVAAVGPEVAMADSVWTEGPGLISSALTADIPLRVIKHPQKVKTDSLGEDISKQGSTEGTEIGKESKIKCSPLTGIEVFEIFAQKKHLGGLQFYHLKVSEDGLYRPYDLHVVPCSKAGSDHYIFSPTSVIHVKDGCSVGLLNLAEWYREAILWKALRDIPFFRDYLLHKAFTRWRRNVCHVSFQRKCKHLQSQLLIAVPQFREALFHLTRLIEKLEKVHWLPQDVSNTYTLTEFQTALLKSSQQSQSFVEKFLHNRSLILTTVQETCYKTYQELQQEVEGFQLSQCSQPLHLQQALIRSLQKKLNQTGQVLQRLGNFTALMDCMIVQNLVSVTHRELMIYFNKVLKREQKNQGSLFQAELTFGVGGQLALFPSMHLFQELLLRALLSVVGSTLQAVDACNNPPDSKASLTASFSFVRGFQQPTPGITNNRSVPVKRAYKKNGSTLTSTGSFPSKEESCVVSNTKLVLPKLSSFSLQGQRLNEKFFPLSRKQLEWHLHHHAGAEEVEKQQARIIQEALQEIQQLCERHSGLVDAYLFASQWSPASLESMRGWPAPKYKEHLQMIKSWINQVHNVPAAFTISNKLITINCSHIQELLEPLLNTMEKDVLNLMSKELQLCAENLINDLKKCMACLKLEPTDLNEFADYASMVKCYKETDLHQKLENLCSLQKTIQLNVRNMIPEEVTLIEETFALWNQFVPLLRTATERVMQQLPSMINTLDNTFSSLTKQLEDLVCSATTGPYLDLNQNSGQIIPNLRIKSRQLHMIVAQLNELSRNNQSLRGQPLDLSFVMTAKQNMEARKELWELMDVSTLQIQEWRLILFSKFVVSEAQHKVNEWCQQANSLAKVIPSSDEVLQETLLVFERFSQQLSLLAKLSSPTMKHKHWANIFKDVDLLADRGENLTVGDLMSRELWEHQNKISKICIEAKAEADMEQAFQRLQQSWEGTVFRLTKFILNVSQKKNPQCGVTQKIKPSADFELTQNASQQNSSSSGTFTIMDLETLMAQAEDNVMTLSSMLFSPHVCDFKREVEIWVQLLQELEDLLDVCERYQQKWIFLSRIFYEMSVSTKNIELIKKFSPVDQMFRELIQAISSDPHVLNFVTLGKTRETNCDFHRQHLRIILIKGLTAMEEICSQLLYLLDSPRSEFPRLCFLSDGEVIELLSLHLTPSSLLPFVRKCFRGVQWFEVDSNSKNEMTNQNSEPDLPSTQMWINGVYGMLKEHVPFVCPLKLNLNPVVCLDHLEKNLHQTVKQLILKCIAARQCPEPEENSPEQSKKVDDNIPTQDHACNFITSEKDEGKTLNVITSTFFKLISEYPLQCLLVAEEVLWYSEICKISLSQAQNKWMGIKAQNTAKLQSLCKAIQDIIADSYNSTLATQHTVTAIRALILLIMKHSQQIAGLVDIKGSLESSFEWQRLMKYRHSVIDNWSNVSQDKPHYSEGSIYVDVLGTQLAYGNEYTGPENWMMVNTTSTERAHLGILLALTSYKCAFISGPLMSGKQRTALQLGWALGQQVITLRCCSNTSFLVVCQMLLGAVQSGAWLVLSSVDSLEQGILSILGQCLTNIHQSLSVILENGQQKELQDHSDKVRHFVKKHSEKITEVKCQVGEKNVLAKPNYGCIIISSNGYSVEIPENLRITTRPVSLMHPDSSIIAEVLLISLGFSEAASLSQRLISLLSLGKDLFCLPEFVCRDQCSWLVLLRKVIDASGIYLYKKFEETCEERPTDLSFNASENILQGYHLSPHKFTSKSSMANAVREEQALIKGVMSVLLSAMSDHNRGFQFFTIFEEIFPAARYYPNFQYIIEESERNALRNAVTEELQQTACCADSQILHNALALHQALKFSMAVVIIGPAGSGKTTLYRALAGALRQLAETSVEENVADTNILSHSCWCSVDTMVLFPNALSHEELFGVCYEQTGSWRDGAFTKVLRDIERYEFSVHSSGPQKVKWLVLDGEPLTCPKWFDSFSTLGNPENPFLCLSSGEKIHPSQERFKILVETTNLGNATPSALARCSLVCISGNDVWKNVWKAEIDALCREHVLDQNTLTMWRCLAEDLFSSTIIFLSHKGFTSILSNEGLEASKSSPGISNGLQEVMSFIKILHALLGESGNRSGLKSASKQKRDPTLKPPSTELHARNLFVIAYIWGFGGQLHPRHWPQFDIFAREALFKCRYKIEVPVKGTVFEHFFNLSDEMLEYANMFTKNRGPQHSCTSVPQYKNYAYLLDRLLEAHYPALLVGEAGSGKTILCKTLLQERPHLHLPVSPLLCSADLRNILERIGSQNTSLDSLGTIMQQQGSLLFVDDLHESAFGKTSATLETLRQCISRDGVQTSDGYYFKLFSSGGISYLGTCRILGTHKSGYSQISPRLSRLFTILVLPVMTADILYSIQSSQLLQWLRKFPPMPKIADMARCIVATTFDVYLAVCEHLSSSANSPHIVFSLYDLQNVFQGMCLFDPRTTAQHLHQRRPSLNFQSLSSPSLPDFDPAFLSPARNILSIARLWMHECLRTFGDRLSSNEESQKLVSFLSQASEKNFSSKLAIESQIFGEMLDPGCQLKSTTPYDINQHGHMTMQQDKVECIVSRKESAPPLMVVVTEGQSKLTESECSEELSSSNSIGACEKPHTISVRPQQLLLEISSSIHDMVFSPEFSRLHICRAQKHLKHNIVYQERDLDVLIEQLTNIVKSKEVNDTYCKYAKFVVYHQRVRQLIHILRALLIPNGHGVLFGAAKKTGRKTTVRLAAYLTGYQLIEIHCGNEVKLKELLKEARHQIDTHGEHIAFMVHENTSQATRDELLVIMKTWRQVDEELKEVRPHISTVVKNSPDQMIDPVKRCFRSKQRHIHVFLLLPLGQHTYERETGQSSVIARHITKALTLCCCVEVYHPWSAEALVEVASVNLKYSVDDSILVANIAQAMAAIHQSATKYASTFLNTVSNQPFSPQTYIELIEYFSHLCDHLCEQGRTQANRLAAILAYFKDLTDTAQDYSQEAFRLKVKFQEAQKELSQLQMAVDTERAVCEQTHQHCLLEEICLSHLQEQLHLAEQQAQDALKEVTPLYQAALKALLSLNQSDLDEVRHYRHPPDGVVILMNAICRLFNCPCNWESGKQLLGQPNFLQELQFFDHSKLSNELFEELGQIVQTPNFQTDLVCGVSQACESLCSWVRAVYQYACVKRCMAPQEAHKDHLNNCMAEIRARLQVARLQEEAAQDRLEVIEKQYQFVRNNLKELSSQLHKVEFQEKEAALTIKQVSYYIKKWNMAKKETNMNDHTIPGKITISPKDVRTSLFDEPQFLSTENGNFVHIPVAMEIHRTLSQALGRDQHLIQALSPNHVLKLLLWGYRAPWAHKWALLTDTQQHKERSSQTRRTEYSYQFPVNAGGSEKEEFELIVSADDPEFINKISHGAKKGLKVLVTEIEHAVPGKEFLSMLDRPGGNHIFDVFHPVKALHPEFCLFLSTSLPANVLLDEIHPLILVKVKVIDLSLSTSEVQDIILSDLIQSKCSELWLKHCQLQRDKQVLLDKLHIEEVSLVDYILQSSTPLLQNPEFLPYVSQCQRASLRLQAEIEDLSNEIDGHKAIMNDFQRITALATALYGALQDVGRLYPFYFFPLCSFLTALQETLALNGWPDVTCSAEMVEGVVMSDISHRIVSHLLAHYRPYLFQSHAELLRLFFSVAFFMHTEDYSEIERVIFLRGLSNIESSDYALEQSAPMLPSWIPTHTKAVLGLLEKISSFHGLISTLRNSSRQWQEYFHFPSATVVGNVPCQSHSQLTTLQRAILWKTFCPQWLAAVVDDLSACQQGQNIRSTVAGGSLTSSPEALSSFLSRNKGPVIVTMPSQTEYGSGSIHPLHWIKHSARHQAEMKGVKVVVLSFGSKCQRDDVLSSLNTAVQTGYWLVLNNCHLLDHWDTRVVTQLRRLISCTGKGHWTNMEADTGLEGGAGNQVHPDFRLWFITKANAPLSIPAFIRMCAMHLVFDSQWDLKDELWSSLRQVTSTVLPAMNMVQPLLRSAILHSVLMQRQKLKHLGHGSIYKWSYEDLLALTDVHSHIAKLCHDPIGALEYVAAYLIYGGHISDSADLEAVKAVCRVCLQPPPSTWGSGPHLLSEMISMRGHFDEDILKAVQHCTEITLNNNDTLLLGFSAEMRSDIVKIRSRSLRILLLQAEDSFAAVRHYDGMFKHLPELADFKMAQERLQALQTKFEWTEESRGVGEGKVSLGPIRTFLQTEWDNLAEKVSSLLEHAFQPSQDLSASPHITSSIISELETRANLLQMYQLEKYSCSPPIYCLAAFANPRGFLAALIRETVHIEQSDISHITLHFQVLGAAASPAFQPSNGICLSGLELHGALWDTQLGALQDTLSPKPCPFPLLWVRAQVRNSNMSSSSHSSPSNSYAMPLYNCPLYLDSQSKDGVWSLSVDNIVTYVPLMTRLDPVLCKMRRVRLVCALKEN
ncbi:dynein heavy chain domain-containing protein 1 isoform X3 [Pangasianodon hypophthalmus]|nr:dynein heavy chain domain-containing protein 1 isoform X3 [Pangasianodon hypophthalmus]